MLKRNIALAVAGLSSALLISGCASTSNTASASAHSTQSEQASPTLQILARVEQGDSGAYRFTGFRPVVPDNLTDGRWVDLADVDETGNPAVQEAMAREENLEARLGFLKERYQTTKNKIDRLGRVYRDMPIPKITFDIDDQGPVIDEVSFLQANDISLKDSMPKVSVTYNDIPGPMYGMVASEGAVYSSFKALELGMFHQMNRSIVIAMRMSRTLRVSCSIPDTNILHYEYDCPSSVPVGETSFEVPVIVKGWANEIGAPVKADL